MALAMVLGLVILNCTSPQPPPTMSIEEIKKAASPVLYDDLMRHNENYIGKIVYYRGEVRQVSHNYGNKYFLRVATKDSFDNVIWVNYEGERLLEDDIIDVWAKVKGLKTYEAILGNKITIPELDSLHVELVTKAGAR